MSTDQGYVFLLRTLRPRAIEAGIDLSKRRKWFAGDGEGDGDADKGGASGEKQFSQADVDRIIAERLKRADSTVADKVRADILKELGVEDVKVAAATLKAAREKADADKTEVQRATDAAAAEKKRAEEAEATLTAERQSRTLERRDTAIRLASQSGKDDKGNALPAAIDPLDVLAWAQREGNKALLEKTLNEDGTVNADGVKALMEAARKNAAHLFAQKTTARPVTPSMNSGQKAASDADEAARQANFRRARRNA